MYDKNGTRYTFGASDNAQQNASASSTQIYTWMLQEIRDTNNNYVRYIYAKDSGQIYPLQILYTGNGGTDGIFKITFSTSTRSDTYTSYKPLFKVTTNYKISQITAAVNNISCVNTIFHTRPATTVSAHSSQASKKMVSTRTTKIK